MTSSNLTLDELTARMLAYMAQHHGSRAERVAYRSALSDAAHLCDLICERAKANNPGRRSGSVSQIGEALADVAKSCGHAAWEMRSKIYLPGDDV